MHSGGARCPEPASSLIVVTRALLRSVRHEGHPRQRLGSSLDGAKGVALSPERFFKGSLPAQAAGPRWQHALLLFTIALGIRCALRFLKPTEVKIIKCL